MSWNEPPVYELGQQLGTEDFQRISDNLAFLKEGRARAVKYRVTNSSGLTSTSIASIPFNVNQTSLTVSDIQDRGSAVYFGGQLIVKPFGGTVPATYGFTLFIDGMNMAMNESYVLARTLRTNTARITTVNFSHYIPYEGTENLTWEVMYRNETLGGQLQVLAGSYVFLVDAV